MNCVETTDPSVPPFDSPIFDDWTINRPLETEADLIAAAAVPGFEQVQRDMIELLNDDDFEEVHTADQCAVCSGEHYGVAKRELIRELELDAFKTEWDPTIRL